MRRVLALCAILGTTIADDSRKLQINVGGGSECGTGTSSPNGYTPCTACLPGEFQVNVGQTSCNACAPCDLGQERRGCGGAHEGSCEDCTAGNYNAVPGGMCEQCLEGQYNARIGSTTCDDCEADTYQDEKGHTYCKPCSACPQVDETRVGCGGASPGVCAAPPTSPPTSPPSAPPRLPSTVTVHNGGAIEVKSGGTLDIGNPD